MSGELSGIVFAGSCDSKDALSSLLSTVNSSNGSSKLSLSVSPKNQKNQTSMGELDEAIATLSPEEVAKTFGRARAIVEYIILDNLEAVTSIIKVGRTVCPLEIRSTAKRYYDKPKAETLVEIYQTVLRRVSVDRYFEADPSPDAFQKLMTACSPSGDDKDKYGTMFCFAEICRRGSLPFRDYFEKEHASIVPEVLVSITKSTSLFLSYDEKYRIIRFNNRHRQIKSAARHRSQMRRTLSSSNRGKCCIIA
eukprot:TRINITY_DN24815_c0_g1_i1.p1 TRINITY_DN24815_c0_g1~~TRINITY_DN24815_c0_g1_i1.p1  ORF type:complete len:262 (+),score=38.16 TRINITY_DN24815_c0_g1_i1:36-788(+)